MGYAKETANDANGREINCPCCGTKNDRDRGTCWSCGKSLNSAPYVVQSAKRVDLSVEMPLSYKVLTVFAYIDVIVGIILCILFIVPGCLAAGIAVIGSGLLLFALLGIWSAVERSAMCLRKIAEKSCA